MVDEHKNVDPELQALKDWWGKHGTSVLTAVILALGAYVAIQLWQRNVESNAQAAAAAWQPVEQALIADKLEETAKLAAVVREQHAKSPYAVQAAMLQAKLAVDSGNGEEAEAHLNWALDQVAKEPLQHVIRIRLARVQALRGQYDEALATISAGHSVGAFAPAYAEARGDILVAKGDRDSARGAYAEALAGLQPGQGDRSTLQAKFDDLASEIDA